MNVVIGILGGVVGLISGSFYVRAVITGKARPHPFTWGAWAVIGAVRGTADLVSGGGWGTGLLFVWTVVAATVCVVALRYNTHEDYGSWTGLIICALGIAGWVILKNPLAASFGVVVADMS